MKLLEILAKCRSVSSSDVHITIGAPPILRVSGELKAISPKLLTKEDTESLCREVLDKERFEILKNTGEMDCSFEEPSVGRFRVNCFRQRGGYAIVMRAINTKIPAMESLGLPNVVKELCNKRRGLILVTGPTGSGKSTTLASMIDNINSSRNEHIITIEDPIEYLHQHKKSIVNQREVGEDTNSFGNALRASLREDPDIILVGEMRDLETIQTAITAAETGHLVLSTLHTIGAAKTIDRIIDVFPPHQQQQVRVQLASVLEAVVSQQLMPVANGNGRVAAFEIMLSSSAVKGLVRESKTHQIQNIIQTSREKGMITMDTYLKELVDGHKITKEIALKFAVDGDALEKEL
ncbi:MAG: type IV pilus twitching motility protein PilT [Lachnospirales bacterium]